jgi:glutamate dehydrogenase/leucine dehydrogenase
LVGAGAGGDKNLGARMSGTTEPIRPKDPNVEYGQPTNLVVGANIAGFVKVADAMIDQGVV